MSREVFWSLIFSKSTSLFNKSLWGVHDPHTIYIQVKMRSKISWSYARPARVSLAEEKTCVKHARYYRLSMGENMAGGAGGGGYSRHLVAVTPAQHASLAEEKTCVKHARYYRLSLAHRQPYFAVSCRPITVKAEDDMEMLSDLVTWGEQHTHNFAPGRYVCARCAAPLYDSADKWKGPCVWPSFRQGAVEGALLEVDVYNYNAYRCRVSEIYCAGCDLFVGHRFEDGRQKGDTHPEARWRH